MTPAERQQLKRDRRKAGLVRLELWVPVDKFERISKAIDRMMQEDGLHEAMAAWLEDQLPKDTATP